jgi:hypothetical protein
VSYPGATAAQLAQDSGTSNPTTPNILALTGATYPTPTGAAPSIAGLGVTDAGNAPSSFDTGTTGAAGSASTGSAASGGTGSAASGSASASGVAAGTSGNPLIDAAEWAANLLNLVPVVGPGIAAVLKDGVQAVAYMTHDLAYALDTAVSVFKPGQAWRLMFGAITVVLGWCAFRAWTGKSMMPSAPAVPVPV